MVGIPQYGQASIPAAFAVVTLLGAASVMTGVAEARADSGVGGLSAVRRRIHFLSVLAGLAAMFGLEGALAHAGAVPQPGVSKQARRFRTSGMKEKFRTSGMKENQRVGQQR
jgi:hypothetical protein